MYEFDSIFDVNDRINSCGEKNLKGKLRRSSLNLSKSVASKFINYGRNYG